MQLVTLALCALSEHPPATERGSPASAGRRCAARRRGAAARQPEGHATRTSELAAAPIQSYQPRAQLHRTAGPVTDGATHPAEVTAATGVRDLPVDSGPGSTGKVSVSTGSTTSSSMGGQSEGRSGSGSAGNGRCTRQRSCSRSQLGTNLGLLSFDFRLAAVRAVFVRN